MALPNSFSVQVKLKKSISPSGKLSGQYSFTMRQIAQE